MTPAMPRSARRPGRLLRVVRRVALAAVAASAAGCLASPAPRDRFYRLEVEAPARLAAPALAGTLEVDRPSADAVTRASALAYRKDASSPEMHTRPYDLWVDSPTVLVQQALATGLREAGLARAVVTPELGVAPDYHLGARLVRFEELRGPGEPRVVVELDVALRDERRGGLVLQARYREEREIAGSELDDVVRAYDAALAGVLARLVADAARGAPP